MDKRPILYGDLLNDYKIFVALSRQRKTDGMSGYVFAIPYSEIEVYLRLLKITNFYQRQRLIERIEFMDQVYCEHINEKKK